MPKLRLTDAQVIELVKQQPTEKQAELFSVLRIPGVGYLERVIARCSLERVRITAAQLSELKIPESAVQKAVYSSPWGGDWDPITSSLARGVH